MLKSPAGRIGIMGGTFDPIHYGHLFAAAETADELKLDKVIFVPTGAPPHKKYKEMAGAIERYEMTLLAITGNERFEISRTETDRLGLSYTLDTLTAMRAMYPQSELFFITGVDAILDIDKWKNPFEITLMCTIAVVKRPGYDNARLCKLPGEIRSSVYVVGTPMLDISATDIRHRVSAGRGVRYLMPESVRAYIEKNGLYSIMDGESI
ncbi:MAG: nicotinate-nucleotide adenylyltransferase [Synergistaceae bacterium]|jgi:nicotinate-nucleotide adenylyltransferase|nr:nicotinate-nucleotide adenylyltransferase [Synergistaceae bacterium]